MSDDARDSIATTMVVGEHLREEAPDGRDRIENSVPILDAMVVEDSRDCCGGILRVALVASLPQREQPAWLSKRSVRHSVPMSPPEVWGISRSVVLK